MSAKISLRQLGEATQQGVLILCALYAAVLFVFAPAILLEKTLSAEWQDTDFRSFFSAAIQLQEAPQTLYQQESQESYQNRLLTEAGLPEPDAYFSFRYPAAFLLLFLPLTAFPPTTAYLLTTALLGAAALISLYLLKQRFHPGPLGLLMLAFVPLYLSIYHTQVSLLLLLALLVAAERLEKKKYWTTGCLLGLLLLKPQLGLIICGLAVLAVPQLLLPIALSGTAIAALSYLLAPAAFFDYGASLLEYQRSARLHDRAAEAMISWQGFATQLSSYQSIPITALAAILSALTCVLSGSVLALRRRQSSPHYSLGIAACCALLAGWHVHLHDAVLALPALYVLSGSLRFEAWRRILLAVWLLYALGYYTLLRTAPMPFVGAAASLLLLLSLASSASTEDRSEAAR